jgi:hypothetical protein
MFFLMVKKGTRLKIYLDGRPKDGPFGVTDMIGGMRNTWAWIMGGWGMGRFVTLHWGEWMLSIVPE